MLVRLLRLSDWAAVDLDVDARFLVDRPLFADLALSGDLGSTRWRAPLEVWANPSFSAIESLARALDQDISILFDETE